MAERNLLHARADATGPHLGHREKRLRTIRANLDQWAFFLDLDGTLIDFAARPEEVVRPNGLSEALAALEAHSHGALALITGQTVEFVDRLFPGYHFSVAGLHGAEFRASVVLPGLILPRPPAPDPVVARDFTAAARMVQQEGQKLEGVLFEDKGNAFALHYRLALHHQAEVERILYKAQRMVGASYHLRPGKCVVELAPAGSDKGLVLRQLMTLPPFRGRCPFAAGDDQTDEAMFLAANQLGGLSVRIAGDQGLRKTKAMMTLPNPSALRAWITELTQ